MNAKGAPIKMRLRFEGGKELAANLEKLSKALSRKIQRDALTEAAEPLRARMGELAPRSDKTSGVHLADDIVISSARGQDSDEVAVAVGPSPTTFYGGLQEFGTAHHGAQPFARPAFDSEVDEALEILAAALWRELAARGIARTVSAPTTPTAPSGGGGLL
jgi:HK97 gp10 family phage protein